MADAALVAAFVYPTALTALSEYLVWSLQARAVIFFISAFMLTLALFSSRRSAGSQPIGYSAVVPLALFLILSIFCTINADIDQIRYDRDAMWRQLAMAMVPVILFWGGRAWGGRQFSASSLDKCVFGVLLFCGASISLEIVGMTGYDYGFRRFGYLGDAIAWVLSFIAVYYVARGKTLLLGASLLLLLMTVSIGAIFIFLAAVSAYFFVSRLTDMRSLAVRVGILIAGVLIFFAAQELIGQLIDRVTGVDLLENDRVRTIEFSLDVFSSHPWFGAGYNAHTYFYNRTVFNMDFTRPFWSTPVSTWAQILADSGVLGFVPFILWVLACCRSAIRALRLSDHDADGRALMGTAAWLLAFLPLNQSAAWLLPSSILSPLVFLVGGIVVGRMSQVVTKPSHQRPSRDKAMDLSALAVARPQRGTSPQRPPESARGES